MTKTELIKQLKELQTKKIQICGITTYDHEGNHIMADKLLLDFINDEKVTKEFEKIHKWYA